MRRRSRASISAWRRVSSGCPEIPMQVDLWRQDAWAEHHRLVHQGCLGRRQVRNRYCESEDAVMATVGNQTGPLREGT